MQGNGSPSSWAVKLLRASVYLFGAVLLLQCTVAMAKSLMWLAVLIAIIVAAVVSIRWWWRRQTGWE